MLLDHINRPVAWFLNGGGGGFVLIQAEQLLGRGNLRALKARVSSWVRGHAPPGNFLKNWLSETPFRAF